jgi:hypothetical protein
MKRGVTEKGEGMKSEKYILRKTHYNNTPITLIS